MTFYSNLSIKKKLSLIAVLTCVTAMALACAALFVYEVQSFKRTVVGELTSQSAILAGLSTAAISFDDSASATEMLGGLSNQPYIKWGIIFKNGKAFARYHNPSCTDVLPSEPPPSFGEAFGKEQLLLHSAIDLKGERVGSIYLCSDTSQLRSKLREYGEILLAVFFASTLAALFMASRLQRSIVIPLRRLSDGARAVADHEDYSTRVTAYGSDELGFLTRTFNRMLDQIESRDARLRESQQRYEVAVMGSSDGLWDWDLMTDTMYFSPRWKSMLGYADQELDNSFKTFRGLLHPEDVGRVEAGVATYLDGRSNVFEIEFRMRHKDGEYRWILSRGVALRDESGKSFRFAGSHTDINPRKEAEDKMVQLHREFAEASRAAGMAEVATGVLHNVGNVLNSVNVSASVVQDRMKESKLSRLVDVAKLLQEHEGDIGAFLGSDPRGKLLPGFLIKLSAHLKMEQVEAVKELGSLARNIEHIKEIVAMQQNYAKVSGVSEILSPVQVVEDVLRMNDAGFVRHGIAVEREFEEVPAITMDKHKVMQIVVNLVRNAKHAVMACEREDKKMVVRVKKLEGQRVVIEVTDNGVGIAPENLTKIFGHGFTTKKDGHGFGLHSGALAAKEMGGSLSVSSDGKGLGARFRLEIPATMATQSGADFKLAV